MSTYSDAHIIHPADLEARADTHADARTPYVRLTARDDVGGQATLLVTHADVRVLARWLDRASSDLWALAARLDSATEDGAA